MRPPHTLNKLFRLQFPFVHNPFLFRESLFPCLPSDSGTQLPAFSFSVFLFRVTGTTQLLTSCFQLAIPLCFRFRFWLLGLSFCVFFPALTSHILPPGFLIVNSYFLHLQTIKSFFTAILFQYFYSYFQKIRGPPTMRKSKQPAPKHPAKPLSAQTGPVQSQL